MDSQMAISSPSTLAKKGALWFVVFALVGLLSLRGALFGLHGEHHSQSCKNSEHSCQGLHSHGHEHSHHEHAAEQEGGVEHGQHGENDSGLRCCKICAELSLLKCGGGAVSHEAAPKEFVAYRWVNPDCAVLRCPGHSEALPRGPPATM